MSLMNEYIDRSMSPSELEEELVKLIALYNGIRNSYLFVYAAAMGKNVPPNSNMMVQDDYYIIHDLMKDKIKDKIDFYLETPGGSGVSAQDIVRFLHDKFSSVSFVVSGEAKSAGTIMVMSGDEILMTQTGSLGPIDAQIKIGRMPQSAHDYMEWVDEKRKEAIVQGSLNQFDAIMVAQITPGELLGVKNALSFATDLVADWLERYKFKNWNETECRKLPVTQEDKRKRAEEIADALANHTRWKLHGRSLKIEDLEDLKLRVIRVDDNPALSDIVYRIQTVCRFLFMLTPTIKIFATSENKIFLKSALESSKIETIDIKKAEAVQLIVKCQGCGKEHKIYAKLEMKPEIDEDMKRNGFKPFPTNAKMLCDCGFETDLLKYKNDIELKSGRKIV